MHLSKKALRLIWRYVRRPRKVLRLVWKIAFFTQDGKTITWGYLGLLLFYIAVNIVVDLPLKWLLLLGSLGKRAGLAAVLNLVPVILGGRTCHIADFLGISLQFYYLLHHWMARIALLHALVHAGVRIRQQEKWTAGSGMGLAVMLLFFFIACSSIFYIRRQYKVIFVWCHRVLAYLSLGFLIAHLWLVHTRDGRIVGITLLCIIAVSALLMLYRWFRLQTAQIDSDRCDLVVGTSDNKHVYTGAVRVKVRLPKDTRIYPGAYFYILNDRDSLWRRLLGAPMMAYEWRASNTDRSSGDDFASDLTFLVEDCPSLPPLPSRTRLTIDGPYGRNLRLHRFDHVFLLAEGIGIASVIPFASTLARRRLHDRQKKQSAVSGSNERLHLDVTRRVTLVWAMEENYQLEWVRDEINRLMKLDPESKLLHIWLYRPTEPDNDRIFPGLAEVQKELEVCKNFPRHCKVTCVPKNRWFETLRKQLTSPMRTSPGTIAVAVCGTPAFRHMVRDVTNEHARADLYELEHQPMPRQRPTVALPEDLSRQLSLHYLGLPARPHVAQQITHSHTEENMSRSITIEEVIEMRSMSHTRQLTEEISA